MKPILLLDVDGVLNVPPRKRPIPKPVRLEWADGKFVDFRPNDFTLPFMQMAWDLFDVRWLTAWGESANVIARHYGLKQRPAIKYREYKAVGALYSLQDSRRPVAWIEDGVDDVAKAVISDKRWTYFHCDPFVGVTEEHMSGLREWAERVMA